MADRRDPASDAHDVGSVRASTHGSADGLVGQWPDRRSLYGARMPQRLADVR